jgi:periplasmic protein TonB
MPASGGYMTADNMLDTKPRTTSSLRVDDLRPRARRAGVRFPLIAALLSIAVHLAAALVVLSSPRLLPREAKPPVEGTVELLMEERKGAAPTTPAQGQPAPPSPEAAKSEAPKPPAQQATVKSTPKPALPDKGDDVVAPPSPPPEQAEADPKPDAPPPASPPPPTAKAPEAPVFDLAGTESESNADVLGGHVLPASPDNRYRNRPPIYPYEAAARGQHGAVLLMIHVSESGLASGVDVIESSGVASLDDAASTAVRKWRFRPALQEGRAVPFDMPFRFVFEAD